MIFGHARFFVDANQVAQLKVAECATIFRGKITGTHAERPELQLQPSDDFEAAGVSKADAFRYQHRVSFRTAVRTVQTDDASLLP
jgi:hypothetical protein